MKMEDLDDTRKRMIDVVLRVPGVIMLELLYMQMLTLRNWTLLMDSYYQESWNFDFLLYAIAFLLLLLPHKVLMNFYSSVISFSCLIASHLFFRSWLVMCHVVQDGSYPTTANITLKDTPWIFSVAKDRSAIEKSVTVVLIQFALSLLSCKVINAERKSLLLFLSPLYPWITSYFSANALMDVMTVSQMITCATAVMYHTPSFNVLKLQMQGRLFWIKMQLISRMFGWQGIITWFQDIYQIQRLLVTSWILRYLAQLLGNLYGGFKFGDLDQTIFVVWDINVSNLSSAASIIALLVFTIVQCLTTTINVFGLVCIVKDMVKLQYFLIRSWLHWSFSNHPPDSVSGPLTGVIDGVTLLIMALYTDIIEVQVEARLMLLIYILLTIASSQFQSIFNIIDPILMTLATAHNGTVWKHIRALMFASVLLTLSGILSYIAIFTLRSSFWIFIIAYNYINTFSLMLGSLAIYCILMVDYLTLRGWTSLDDIMFYIRASCRAVEFCITLCMCGYIMMTIYTEISSFMGIVILAVYMYYCVVQRGGKGWKIWVMRRQAANKVKSLSLASKQELAEKREDLCPICYQAMESDVRIMHCRHFFHENCLKKWFYIQDKCPMCYAEFKSPNTAPDSKSNEPSDAEDTAVDRKDTETTNHREPDLQNVN